MTNRTAIEKGLQKRLKETRNWVSENQGVEISGIVVRGFPARLKVIKFLDDNRAEANGIRFRLFFGNPTKHFFTDLDVRINPHWVMAEGKDDTAPYIVIYVLDANGSGDSLKWFYFVDQDQLKENLDVGDWYLNFVNRSIKPGADGKIMTHRVEVETQ